MLWQVVKPGRVFFCDATIFYTASSGPRAARVSCARAVAGRTVTNTHSPCARTLELLEVAELEQHVGRGGHDDGAEEGADAKREGPRAVGPVRAHLPGDALKAGAEGAFQLQASLDFSISGSVYQRTHSDATLHYASRGAG